MQVQGDGEQSTYACPFLDFLLAIVRIKQAKNDGQDYDGEHGRHNPEKHGLMGSTPKSCTSSQYLHAEKILLGACPSAVNFSAPMVGSRMAGMHQFCWCLDISGVVSQRPFQAHQCDHQAHHNETAGKE